MADLVSETKDDQKFKDHLVAKYEKKRYFILCIIINIYFPYQTFIAGGTLILERSHLSLLE